MMKPKQRPQWSARTEEDSMTGQLELMVVGGPRPYLRIGTLDGHMVGSEGRIRQLRALRDALTRVIRGYTP